jgi:hypothetical protein
MYFWQLDIWFLPWPWSNSIIIPNFTERWGMQTTEVCSTSAARLSSGIFMWHLIINQITKNLHGAESFSQPNSKDTACLCGTRSFIIVFTWARYWTSFWDRWTQTTSIKFRSFQFSSYLKQKSLSESRPYCSFALLNYFLRITAINCFICSSDRLSCFILVIYRSPSNVWVNNAASIIVAFSTFRQRACN